MGFAAGFASSADATQEYYLFRGQRNWNDARSWCASHWGGAGPSADLATISSEEEMNAFKVWMNNMASTDMYSDEGGGIWMGYTDSSSEGNWVSVESSAWPAYLTWKDGEPNNWGGNEHCPVIANSNMEFVDVDCGLDNYYVCSLNGSFTSPCQAVGTHW